MAKLKYLLDTHAFLWAATDPDKLGAEAARAIAMTPYPNLAISDVTLQEIGLLLHGGRIAFKGSPASVLGQLLDYVTILPISLEIALLAPSLALPHGDQFDRIIAATAKAHRLILITKDTNLTDAKGITTLWSA